MEVNFFELEMFEEMKKIVTPDEMEVAVFTDDKQTREGNIREITEKLEAIVTCQVLKSHVWPGLPYWTTEL